MQFTSLFGWLCAQDCCDTHIWERRAGAFTCTSRAQNRTSHELVYSYSSWLCPGNFPISLVPSVELTEVVGLPWGIKSLTWIWGLMWMHDAQEFRREAVGVVERWPVYLFLFLIQVGKLQFCPLGNNFASVCASPHMCVLQDGRGCL